MIYRSFLAVCLSLTVLVPVAAQVEPPAPTSATVLPTTPQTKPDGKKWRLAYVGSGDYVEYPSTLRAIAQGLQQLGWISIQEIPEGLSSKDTWNFLAKHAKSATLTFVEDAWVQPGNFDASLRPVVRETVTKRLRERGDIDLIIAMGTWAGQDMAALGAPVPTIVVSTSDPVGAGIVASADDSGMNNLHARVQPQRYQRQVRLFHEIVPFKTLGLVYEDSPEGRTYAAVPAVEQVAKEQGFEVKSCYAASNNIDAAQAQSNALACYKQLSTQVDAIYVTVHRGVTPHNIDEIAAALRDAKVPSFAMLGSVQVRAGLLMSLAQADYSYVGLFHAETIARIFNGAQPRQLSQIWVDPPKIAVNLETARRIGFDPPVDILLAADEVYEEELQGTIGR